MLIFFALPTVFCLNVITIAGNGYQSLVDGQDISAEFNWPSGVALDTMGNIFVADAYNNAVRKINASGYVTTIASGFPLYYLTVDILGNVYVASNNLNVIKKIDINRSLSTYAGSGSDGSNDGQGLAASFSSPIGIIVVQSGTIYVMDFSTSKARKINATGYVSTIAGSGLNAYADGQGASASFNYPHGIVADPSGNLYVGDYSNNLIRKINSTGYVSTFAGSGNAAFADGQSTSSSFSGPSGVSIDVYGNIYVADYFNNRIRKINSTGYVSTIAGSGAPLFKDGSSRFAAFDGPSGVAVDAFENVFVADQKNNRIRKISNILYTASTISRPITIASPTGSPTAILSPSTTFPSPTFTFATTTGTAMFKSNRNIFKFELKQHYW